MKENGVYFPDTSQEAGDELKPGLYIDTPRLIDRYADFENKLITFNHNGSK